MEIHSLALENYKQFKFFSGNFGERDNDISKLSLKFLVGNNGSGKTTVMQAIGLIFTRAMNDESPGFKYEIIYSIARGDKTTYILLSNDTSKYRFKGRVHIRISNDSFPSVKEGKVIKERFSERDDLHPRRIVSFASGPNNSLEGVLIDSPLNAINSDIYDELHKKELNGSNLNYLRQLRGKLLYEPSSLNFDSNNATLILAALLLSTPANNYEVDDYNFKKNELFLMVKNITPYYISLEIDEENFRKLQNSYTDKKRYERMFLELVEHSKGESRIKIIFQKDRIVPKAVRTITFSVEQVLSVNPTEFLTMLMFSKKENYLYNANVFFKHNDTEHLLDQTSLSDGEYLWLCRMALIILSQQENDENTLFLFDEPDVFLNENWTMQFISKLHEFVKSSTKKKEGEKERYNRQEYWIATHSTLILTDAFPNQTLMIEPSMEVNELSLSSKRGAYEAMPLSTSTFAADRSEVSMQLFMDQRIGEYSMQYINNKLDNDRHTSVEALEKVVDKIGPGYQRYRMLEYLQQIRNSSRGLFNRLEN